MKLILSLFLCVLFPLLPQTFAETTVPSFSGEDLQGVMNEGKNIYRQHCLKCHQMDGTGVEEIYPPLAGSDFLIALANAEKRETLIGILINGFSRKVTVKGKEYLNIMPPMPELNDHDLASVLTFVSNSWGNAARPFEAAEIAQTRSKVQKDNTRSPLRY